MQCAWGWGNRKEKRREGKEGRKGKGQFNWKGGRLLSSGLWEQWGHTSQLPSSLRNQAQSKHTCSLRTPGATWGPNHNNAGGKGTEGSLMQWGWGGARRGQEGPWARHLGSSGNGAGVRDQG